MAARFRLSPGASRESEVTRVRVAVLIVAHRDVDQLNQLVALLATDFEVFIHLDARSAIGDGDVAASEHVTLIRRRRVHWGSYGMILATLDLMSTAAAGRFDRYLLISGQDLPVRSNAEIEDFFALHEDEEFIECEALPRVGEPENGWMDRVTRYYLPSARGVPGLRGRAQYLAFRVFYRLNTMLGVSRSTEGVRFYGGANWWNLTHEAVEAVLDLQRREPRFMRRFRMTSCGDEIFVQSALVALGFRDRIVSTSLRYTEWEPGAAHPRTLGVDDLDRARQSGALFARKFDSWVDQGQLGRHP